MFRAVLVLAVLVGALLARPALAERRVALVIGNAAYQTAAPLKNPANDAADISAALQRLGFEVVAGNDLDAQSMRRTVKRFADVLPGADVALFFYAGHAVQVNGKNYLAPVDADLQKESDLDFETVSLDLVRRQMEREATTQLVFLDACRDNPLTRRFISAARSTRAGAGLARLETAAEGTFIAFATQPDNVALEGAERNSPFIAALLRNIDRPGVEISALMTDVRRDVYEATDRQQLPWTNSSLLGSFYFNPPEPALAQPGPDTDRSSTLERLEREAQAYEAIRQSTDLAVLAAFLQEHPSGIYAPLVRQTIVRLVNGDDAAGKPEPLASRGAPAAIDGPAADSAAAADAVRAEPAPAETGPRRSAVRSIQQELARAGCNPGPADGLWGRNSRRALDAFADHAGLDLPSLEPDAGLLDRLQAHPGRVCPEPPALSTVATAAGSNRPSATQAPAPRAPASSPSPAQQTIVPPSGVANATPEAPRPASACFRFNGEFVCD